MKIHDIGTITITSGTMHVDHCTIDFDGTKPTPLELFALVREYVNRRMEEEGDKLQGATELIDLGEGQELEGVSLTADGLVKTADVIDFRNRQFWEDKQ